MGFRDASIIVIETSRTFVRAGLGIHDLLKTPTVGFQARVGFRRTEDKDKAPVASTSRTSSLPQSVLPGASVTDYVVGTALDEALAANQDLVVSWPFAEGTISDWTQAEALWKHALFNQLGLRRAQMESPVILSLPPGLSRQTHEHICQLFFERFNVAGFTLVERPTSQLYATTAPNMSGVVVDVGLALTDVTPINEGFPCNFARASTRIGQRDCEAHLAHVLRMNQSVKDAGFGGDSDEEVQARMELVKQLCRDSHIKVGASGESAVPGDDDEGVTDIAAVVMAGKEKAVIESGQKKKLTAKATAAEQARAREIEAMDLLTVEFKGHTLTLGKERHRLCEPLFDPDVLRGVPGVEPGLGKEDERSVQEVVGHAVGQTEVDVRQYIWQGLFVTGDVTKHVHGISLALQSRLAPFMASPELITDVQPRSSRTTHVPEYYAEYRDTGDCYAAFLGTSITAKLSFNDTAKHYVSKLDYSAHGPHAIIEMAPALL